jgi:hypothetical protein
MKVQKKTRGVGTLAFEIACIEEWEWLGVELENASLHYSVVSNACRPINGFKNGRRESDFLAELCDEIVRLFNRSSN